MKVRMNGRVICEGSKSACDDELRRQLCRLSVDVISMTAEEVILEQHDLTLGDTPDADVAYFAGIPVDVEG